ncbi:MAG TPA: sulfotransferase [Gemmataceae bacterium]|nr:sulfotransferase [Gemmataceae bacterium]
MSTAVADQRTGQHQPARKQEWMPRVWQGCDFVAWLRLLVHNRFAVHWPYWYIAAIATAVSFCHTVLRYIQQGFYGRRVARTPIHAAPIFIIGHWRTGTTLLHEMLILDDRHTYPNTYKCFEPNHFLLTERLITHGMPFLMPSHRPMDNMAAGWDRPQEDEFALCMMGQPSPYLTIAFPNHGPQYSEYFDLRGISPRALASWKRDFLRFIQYLNYQDSKRLVLKSPPHTFRIPVLLELFPDARFVHIVRDPYIVFPSTVNLWKSLYRTHALQRPTFAGLEEYVFTTFQRMYEALERDRQLVRPSRFHELRYEDLVRDPIGQMQALYDQLELGEFEKLRPRLQDYAARTAGYETNRYTLTPQLREEIGRRWGKVIRQYGYGG